MNRAVVYLFWGQQFLAEAVRSATSARKHLSLPIIAITDEHTAPSAEATSQVFDRVIVRTPHVRSNLAKADLYHLLPNEFDSFLFLDSDTVVLADVGHGFLKAEQYGLAAVMAPHYSLNSFWDFGRVLAHVGQPELDQLLYNSGVLFFARSTEVERLMRRWSDLCGDIGARLSYSRDQPFLTLAMEQLGFNPFALSPSYNYRAFGETASGLIRIWHSRAAVPADVNVTRPTTPFRHFVGSRRAIVTSRTGRHAD
jgi:hypothetical protein